jgi:hypothetical protein
LQVGSQAAGDIAGLIMNGGDIDAGTLAFGAAEERDLRQRGGSRHEASLRRSAARAG